MPSVHQLFYYLLAWLAGEKQWWARFKNINGEIDQENSSNMVINQTQKINPVSRRESSQLWPRNLKLLASECYNLAPSVVAQSSVTCPFSQDRALIKWDFPYWHGLSFLSPYLHDKDYTTGNYVPSSSHYPCPYPTQNGALANQYCPTGHGHKLHLSKPHTKRLTHILKIFLSDWDPHSQPIAFCDRSYSSDWPACCPLTLWSINFSSYSGLRVEFTHCPPNSCLLLW